MCSTWTPIGNQCLCILFVINMYFVVSVWVYSVIRQRFVIRRQSLDRHQHGSLRDKAPGLRAGSSSNLGTKLMMMALHDATWIMMLHSATRCYTALLCATWCYMVLHGAIRRTLLSWVVVQSVCMLGCHQSKRDSVIRVKNRFIERDSAAVARMKQIAVSARVQFSKRHQTFLS